MLKKRGSTSAAQPPPPPLSAAPAPGDGQSDSNYSSTSGNGSPPAATSKKSGFKDWKRRVGETALQKIGLATASNDENSANIDAPLANFTNIRESLLVVQAQIHFYVQSVESMYAAVRQMAFLYAPLSGDTAKQAKASLCRETVHEAVIRGDAAQTMREYLEAPLRAALEFCDELDSLIKRRAALVLDYDHHKRKLHAAAQRHEAAVAK
eukprot:6952-Heterococcus_DN1.PRE.1